MPLIFAAGRPLKGRCCLGRVAVLRRQLLILPPLPSARARLSTSTALTVVSASVGLAIVLIDDLPLPFASEDVARRQVQASSQVYRSRISLLPRAHRGSTAVDAIPHRARMRAKRPRPVEAGLTTSPKEGPIPAVDRRNAGGVSGAYPLNLSKRKHGAPGNHSGSPASLSCSAKAARRVGSLIA